MSLPALFPDRRVIVLDGGTGTALADEASADTSSHLWGAGLLRDDPATLQALVRKWEHAGAQIVQTCSYQATVDGILAALHPTGTPDDALALLRSSVSLVRSALQRPATTRVALSLGPYGATLRPGREYTGLYDPPFAPPPPPPEPSAASASEAPIVDPETALAQWHLARLAAFAADEPTWRAVDLVMLETIPNLDEARAIRRAWAALELQLEGTYGTCAGGRPWWRKPLVMSFVFPGPGGSYPRPASGPTPLAEDVIAAALEAVSTDPDTAPRPAYARPDAVGINCTKPQHLPRIVDRWSRAVPRAQDPPWLFLYPDGGLVYDVHTRTWAPPAAPPPPGDEGARKVWEAEGWAEHLAQAGAAALAAGVWGGVVLGGCCKAGTSHIRALERQCRGLERLAGTPGSHCDTGASVKG